MDFRPTTYFYLLLCCLPLSSFSQIGCEYKLELYDAFGDGWNEGFLTVSINGKSEDYPFENGSIAEISLFVTEGDSLSISFIPGFFTFEASFSVFDSEGTELFFSGQDPPQGEVYRTTIICPACPTLLDNGVIIDQVRHDRARVSWIPNDPEGSYLLRVGNTGMIPEAMESVRILKMSTYEIGGLEEQSRYDIYLQGLCSNGDTTELIGPFSFETLWAKDVGIAALVSPVSDCGLAADTRIEVTLKNFGGAPQTLIPFNYSVNGVLGAVNQPTDGFFTGILSHNGVFSLNFDATYDFSSPEPYEIKVWTELADDKNPANDTLKTIIVHTPLISQYPYRMDFEGQTGGWMLDEQASSDPSLEWGIPDGNVIRSAAGGQQAWVTNLDGDYNNNERSVLLSPCFDLSEMNKDPELSFYLWVSTESTFDGIWVEISRSGGPWTKLGNEDGAGTFWYNTIDDIYGDWWSGNNIYGGWRQVRHPLTGMAGESNVRIRFVFQSDEAVVREGVGIDDISVAPVLGSNLQALEVGALGAGDCGSDTTRVILTFRNEGTSEQENFQLAYRIDDGPEVSALFPDAISPGSTSSYTFDAVFDSSEPRAYTITAWTDLSGDELTVNDTVVSTYSSAGPGLPFLENFESGDVPTAWILDEDLIIDKSHNSGSSVLFDNLWEDDTLFQAVTPLLGSINAGDTLYFSYRFVDFTGLGTNPTALGPNDVLYVEVSEDCGLSFNPIFEINADNHQVKNTPATLGVPLDDYDGQWIKIRFRAIWGSGDYYLDLDNINIRRCPAGLGLQASVMPPTGGEDNGSIRIEGTDGIGPYFYRWDNGNRTASMSGLAAGNYAITVTDQQGCSDQISVTLESVVAVQNPVSNIQSISLAPNPNSGQSHLNINLKKTEAISISIFDLRGRLLRSYEHRQTSQLHQPIDLSEHPSGIYFVRVRAGHELRTVRLLKANVP